MDPINNNSVHRITPGTGLDSTATTRRADSVRSDTPNPSSDASHLNRLSTGDTSQDIDTARVAEIRQGIADGTLTFDSGRIADGLIASARELAGDD
ncbi:flagellar biosynthesis anti-sigma factor FlgM [Salinisphaera sp. Q1T1-3]|uniref:flagellar biosynthesis anti-sigma factor FlgM n=1 Tax=Salinisphaera sp. Q1T1-3 TaxID=2321229 RepID=UPI000E715FE0|nr:flagellar biosynthesis anti-sigma factor FlgM [Salinisphaera sp. Q1T1-3]RJS95176.1 flagellar biosynthesis anti-sigma factor FlgM [Salinisphaera sp. Q1T1-3]